VDGWVLVEDLSIDDEDDGAGLVIAGLSLLAGGFDCAIAPDSANALNATPIMSLFNIFSLQKRGFGVGGRSAGALKIKLRNRHPVRWNRRIADKAARFRRFRGLQPVWQQILKFKGGLMGLICEAGRRRPFH
jgi:hypothetical protein